MSLLRTDGYKFSMAEAGWPLRQETFYYAQRKGGAAILPFDVETELQKLMPMPTDDDYAYLAAHEYEMGAGFKAAVLFRNQVVVRALPKGTWFLPREPVFSVTGPSALVSWLEPLALHLHYRIQLASLALTEPSALAAEVGTVTCEEQKDIVLSTLDSVGVRAPKVMVDSEAYFERVRATAANLVRIVGDPARIFEVGLRAATCVKQHELALQACKAAGIRRTSHVWAAARLDMIPVGTMGHEHVQRFGSDEAAFRAMRDRRPGRSSYLLDTFDTIRSGIPAAFRLMGEEGYQRRGDSIRYDSGDKEMQYRYAAQEARKRGIRTVQILEDGFDAAQTEKFEVLRREVGWTPEEQFYGYGGYLIAKPSGTSLVRDRVAAVYKLSQTATSPTMKFGDDSGIGKESIPGNPVVFRRRSGDGPRGVIGQAGEPPPQGYEQLTGGDVDPPRSIGALDAPPSGRGALDVALSDATQALAAKLHVARKALVAETSP
ncbi:nicotinate phosphoribosyltransferase [Pendulispora albinea]|uniref:nicotinate phosphoribosyltransferase n=1 Tax=Pendulispora albinea TaxID=2741071 RepID=A0ABZ2LZW4_9BACT